jgi:hypothetical protein
MNALSPRFSEIILQVLANAKRQASAAIDFLFASRPEHHTSLAFSTWILPRMTMRIAFILLAVTTVFAYFIPENRGSAEMELSGKGFLDYGWRWTGSEDG